MGVNVQEWGSFAPVAAPHAMERSQPSVGRWCSPATRIGPNARPRVTRRRRIGNLSPSVGIVRPYVIATTQHVAAVRLEPGAGPQVEHPDLADGGISRDSMSQATGEHEHSML